MKALNIKDSPHYLDQFREFTNLTSPISDESWLKMCGIMRLWRVEKGAPLLKHKEVESAVRFLGKGIVKCIDQYNDQSFVYDFRVAPIILSETVSFFNGTPSRISLECITECEFIELPREPFLKIIYANMDISKFAIIGVANYLSMTHHKQALLRTLDADDRYKQFLKEYPLVALKGKLEDIASYIGVRQQSLSRIRKNVRWDDCEKPLEILNNEIAVINSYCHPKK